MALTRQDKAEMGLIGRQAMQNVVKAAQNNGKATMSRSFYQIKAIHADTFTMDVISGIYTDSEGEEFENVLYGIRYTSACAGAVAGQMAVVDTNSNVSLITGVIGASPYPVGSIYMSYESTSPAQLFGGTWTQLTGVFPRFANDTATGGADSTSYSFDHNHYMSLERPSGATWNFVTNRSGIGYHDGDAAIPSKAVLTSTSALTTLQGVYGPVSAYGGANGKPLGDKTINAMPAYQDVYAWRRTA